MRCSPAASMRAFTLLLLLAAARSIADADDQTSKNDSHPLLMLILMEDGKLWSVNVDNDGNTSKVQTFHADDFDYDASERRLYWLDNGRVYSQTLENGTIQRLIFEYVDYERLNRRIHKGSIAFDEITRKMYLTDGNHQVDVFDADLNRYTLFEDDRRNATIGKMILDSGAGFMFFSVNCNGTNEIHRANMDGTSRKVLIADPHGDEIAIDRSIKKLFWFNKIRSVVEQADYEGKSRSVLVSKLSEPAIFGVLNNQVVWLPARQVPIGNRHSNNPSPRKTCKLKNDACTEEVISTTRSAKLYPLKEIVPKAIESPCAEENAGCEQGCMLRPNGEVGCVCRLGWKAAEDDPKRCVNARPKRQLIAKAHRPMRATYPIYGDPSPIRILNYHVPK